MYVSTGWNASEMGDVDVIAHDGRIHVFYLSLPSHDVVAHVVSDDGLTWQRLPNAITTGEPGAFDDDQIWTMGTFAHASRFFMLYTALGKAEAGLLQRVGLATSDDLIHWQKYPGNPVIEADPRWYEARIERDGERGRVDWRDPFVYEEDGILHGLISARENVGASNRRGCVGYFTSTDGFHWEVQPPFYAPRVSYDFEVPTLFKLDGVQEGAGGASGQAGPTPLSVPSLSAASSSTTPASTATARYYLTGIAGGHERDVYRVADALRGPWRRPAGDGLLPTPNHAFRTCRWRGQQLLFHWVRGQADWVSGVSLAVLAPPKVAAAGPDGVLILQPFEDWSPLHAGDAETSLGRFFDAPERQGKAETLMCEGTQGFSACLSRGEYADAIFEVDVEAGAGTAEFGIVLRAGDAADQGTFVSCVPGRQRVELVNLVHFRRGLYGIRGRGRTLAQSFHHDFGQPGATGTGSSGTEASGRHVLRVVAHGPLVEASVDGQVVLSCLTMRRRRGWWGVFVEDGSATFHSVRLQPLQAPAGFGLDA